VLATADCELMGRQVGAATATDEVEDTAVNVVSVIREGSDRYTTLLCKS